jgi:molybdopterin-binding protein
MTGGADCGLARSMAQVSEDQGTIPNPPLAAVRDLVVRRESLVVLDIPYMEVRQGEVLSVIGPNGAGKSTLLHVLALLHPATSGEIWFAGQRVSAGNNVVKLRRRMAVVFQESLLLDTSVKDNVASGLRIRGMESREAGERASYWMKRFGVDALAERPARKLSGGEAQRASLARAFAMEPELLLLDEPFSALDAPTRAVLFEDFERVLHESRLTTVFVTHDRTEAMRLGDRVAVMMSGKVAQLGEPEEVFSTPADERVAAFVGVENLIPGQVVEQSEGLALVSLRVGYAEAVSDIGSGHKVLACLRPEDVVLGPVPLDPPTTSARNKLRGRITRLIPLGSQVRVMVDCGFPLVALITRRSSEDLGFHEDMEVLVSFKASSVHLLPR